MPTITDEPALAGTSTERSPSIAFPPETDALSKFIAGEPINPATNALAGLSYKFRGVSTC